MTTRDPEEGIVTRIRHQFQDGKALYTATVYRGETSLYVTPQCASYGAAWTEAERFLTELRGRQQELGL